MNRPLPPDTRLFSKNAQKVFEGVRFKVYQWKQKLFDNTEVTYETVRRNDTVLIIPIINDEIVLVTEIQPHWDKPGTTLVAGAIEDAEDLKTGARREMEEETGMVFENYYLVDVEEYGPTIEWFCYTFIAKDFKFQKEKHLDAGEKNEVVRLSIDEFLKRTLNRELKFKPRFVEKFLMQNKTNELLDVFNNPQKYSIDQ